MRYSHAEGHSGDLRVKNRTRYRATNTVEDFHILPRGVKHFGDAFIQQKLFQRREVNIRGRE